MKASRIIVGFLAAMFFLPVSALAQPNNNTYFVKDFLEYQAGQTTIISGYGWMLVWIGALGVLGLLLLALLEAIGMHKAFGSAMGAIKKIAFFESFARMVNRFNINATRDSKSDDIDEMIEQMMKAYMLKLVKEAFGDAGNKNQNP